MGKSYKRWKRRQEAKETTPQAPTPQVEVQAAPKVESKAAPTPTTIPKKKSTK